MSNTLHNLGQDANKLAHEQVIDPAMELINDAKSAVQNRATQAKNVMVADANQAQESLGRLCHQTGNWIADNPFTAVGLAFLAGGAMVAVGRSGRA